MSTNRFVLATLAGGIAVFIARRLDLRCSDGRLLRSQPGFGGRRHAARRLTTCTSFSGSSSSARS